MSNNPKIDVIVGGQFGSESKGRVTLDTIVARLNQGYQVTSTRVAGPNAGHVVIDSEDRRWAMRQVPVGFAASPDVHLYIAPGSEVDLSVLRSEVESLEHAGYSISNRLTIHPEATLLTREHIEQEQQNDLSGKLGSTAKGIGAARSERIWRKAKRVGDVPWLFENLGQISRDTETHLQWMLASGGSNYSLVIEGTQGYGLGLHAGHYPQCTSSNCRAIDFAAMCGVTPTDLVHPQTDYRVTMVIRPYPIRVAGNSGALAGETSWSALGLPDEHTTVTGKVRRVGKFDPAIVSQAYMANGARNTWIALAMADQLEPDLANVGLVSILERRAKSPGGLVKLRDLVAQMPARVADRIVQLGTSPSTHIDLEEGQLRELLGLLGL